MSPPSLQNMRVLCHLSFAHIILDDLLQHENTILFEVNNFFKIQMVYRLFRPHNI